MTDKHNDRSYSVQTPDGASYRRNRRHLLKTSEQYPDTPDFELQTMDDDENDENELFNAMQQNEHNIGHDANVLPNANVLPGTNAPQPGCTFTRSGRRVKPRDILNL